jgi:hypothetical protein
MSKQVTKEPVSHDSLIVIVHRIDDTWRCLFANVEDGSPPSLLETTEVRGDNELDDLLVLKSPSQIYAILPGSETVCRTTTLPDVDDDQIVEALRLQAEAKLLGGTPLHRRAHAPLESAIGETNRIGIIVTWPESSTFACPTCLDDALFIPDAVSVAALLNGSRPTEPIIFADFLDGTVTIALTHANGAAIRATQEISSSKDSFFEGIIRTTNETALLHNHTDSFVQQMSEQLDGTLKSSTDKNSILILPKTIVDNTLTRIRNCTSIDNNWWNTWGIAIGGLLAVTGSMQPLTIMHQKAIEVHPSSLEKITNRLDSRSFSNKLLIVAVLLLAFGSTVVSGIRLGVLSFLNPNIEERYSQTVLERKQHIVYKELAKSAWPMTKLISDIVNNVPIGIDIDSLQIDVGEPISIRGRAINADGKSAAELIALLQEKLQQTGAYKDIEFSYNPAGTYGDREFDLWATVSDSLKRPRYKPEKDFGHWTLAMRQAGIAMDELDELSELESETVDPPLETDTGSPLTSANIDEIPDNTEPPAHVGDHEDRVRTDRTRTGSRESGAKSHSDARDAGGAKSRVPDPLSPDLIKTMTRDEANIALKDVTEGLKRIGRTDPDTKKRLRTEMRLLLDRLKEVPE